MGARKLGLSGAVAALVAAHVAPPVASPAAPPAALAAAAPSALEVVLPAAPPAQDTPAPAQLFLPHVGKSDPWLLLVAERTMGMTGALEQWDWEAGVAMVGLMYAYEQSGDPEVLRFVAEWTDRQLRERRTFADSPRVAPDCRSDTWWPDDAVWHLNHVTPAWAVMMLYEHQPRPEYRLILDGAVRFLVNDACRVDGVLEHVPGQVWDDTLMNSVPLLARYAAAFDRPELTDLAAEEVLAHARRLQDPRTGLWYHGWGAAEKDHLSGAFWARGNGWAALAMTELLQHMPLDHPRRDDVAGILERQLTGLIAQQDPSGLWHTVVDRPDFYLETSGSAAIASAILTAADAGWIDEGWWLYGGAARKAVRAKVAQDGTVEDVSAGTGVPQIGIDLYNRIRHDAIQPHGQGLYMVLAASAEGR